jgi:hypothetical protein
MRMNGYVKTTTKEVLNMMSNKAGVAFLIGFIVSMSTLSVGVAGDGPKLPLKHYEGQIKAIKIDRCGIEPGQCIGSIILAQKEGGEVTLGIRPGTWLKRGGIFVYIEDLGVGNHVIAEAVALPGDRLQQITVLNSSGE